MKARYIEKKNCKNIDYSFWGGQCRPAIITYMVYDVFSRKIGWVDFFIREKMP